MTIKMVNDSRLFAFVVVVFENISYYYGGLIGVALSFLLILFCLAGLLKEKECFFGRIALLSMLMIGEWTYVSDEALNTVYSLRALGISAVSLLLLISVLTVRHTKKTYIVIFLFFAIVSIGYLVFERLDHLELFARDLKTYILLTIALILISEFFQKEILLIALRAGVLQVLLAFLFQNKFDYGGENYYLIQSSIVFIFLPILCIGAVKNKYELYLYVIIFCILYYQGQLFLGGKSFLFILLVLGYLVFRKPIVGVPLVAIFWGGFYVYLEVADPIALYKIQQIFQLRDLSSVMSSQTSAGNIVGEAYTLVRSWGSDMLSGLIGNGVGGGLSDRFLLFESWVGKGGYDTLQYESDHYVRLHLSVLNYLLKFGLIAFFIATIWLYKLVPRHNWATLTLITYPLFLMISDANLSTFFVCVLSIRYLMEKDHESIRPNLSKRTFSI